MNAFSTEWLALREAADAAARAVHLVDSLNRVVRRPLRLLDLGCGSGANLRYLAPRLSGGSEWLLVDRDPAMLAALARHPQPPGARWDAQPLDLAEQLDQLSFERFDWVVCAALLDLVSAGWIGQLARCCAQARARLYCALSYDGSIEWAPAEPEDESVRTLLNLHQGRDKGFGLALGPEAATVAMDQLSRLGYQLSAARSDWQLGPDMRALQSALASQWHAVALELAPEQARVLERWRERRLAQIAAGASSLRVGHIDFVALPPTSGARR